MQGGLHTSLRYHSSLPQPQRHASTQHVPGFQHTMHKRMKEHKPIWMYTHACRYARQLPDFLAPSHRYTMQRPTARMMSPCKSRLNTPRPPKKVVAPQNGGNALNETRNERILQREDFPRILQILAGCHWIRQELLFKTPPDAILEYHPSLVSPMHRTRSHLTTSTANRCTGTFRCHAQ